MVLGDSKRSFFLLLPKSTRLRDVLLFVPVSVENGSTSAATASESRFFPSIENSTELCFLLIFDLTDETTGIVVLGSGREVIRSKSDAALETPGLVAERR